MGYVEDFHKWRILEDKNDPYGEENWPDDHRVPANVIESLNTFITHSQSAKEAERVVSNNYEKILPASIDFLSSDNVYVDGRPIAEMRGDFDFVEFRPSYRGRTIVVMTLMDDIGSELENEFDQDRWNRYIDFLSNYGK